MKHVVALLFCLGSLQAAVIYTDTVHVTGSGTAWDEFLTGPGGGTGGTSGGWSIQFGGENGDLSVFVDSFGMLAPGLHGRSLTSLPPNPHGGMGAQVLGPLGDFASMFYSYSVMPTNSGGYLTLYDSQREVLVTVPIVGYFGETLLSHESSSGRDLYRYSTFIAPNPEPATWAMMFLGGAGLILLHRKKLRRD